MFNISVTVDKHQRF